MIKNIVFDFGQVLVRFDPEYMVSRYTDSYEDLNLLKDVIFDRIYWDRLDAGTISDEEVIKLSCARIPERLWETAEKIYYNWIYNIPEIDGMRELVEDLKRKGFKLLLLSNISVYFAEHKSEIPILKYFDDCIFSATCGYTKPQPQIFQYLCSENNINPRETIFIDDSIINIKGAENYGIKSYLFNGDVKALKEFLEKTI